MLDIRTNSNFEQVNRALRLVGEKHLPEVFVLAATRTAQKVRTALLNEMARTFDRPTPLTLRSLMIKTATKNRPEARVWFKDTFSSGIPADRYLQPQVQGGQRRPKRLEAALRSKGILGSDEWAIPSKDILNQYGNLPGSLAMRILSGLGAAETQRGSSANASSSRRSRKKGNARRYFVAKIANTHAVWERKQTAFGAGIRPVVLFVKKAPEYRAAFDFFKIAEETVALNYPDQFNKSLGVVLGRLGRL